MKNILALLVALFLTAISAHAADLTFYGAGEIGNPRCVTVAPNGEVWVGTSGRIAIFGATGKFLRYDARVPNQINSIAFDKEGKLVIGTNDGFLAWQQGEKFKNVGDFGAYSPWEVVADDQGFVWATDGGHATIRKFRRVGELVVLDATIKAPDNEPMGRPYSLAFDAKDHLVVSDEQKPGLWVFGRDGAFVKRILPTEGCGRMVRRGAELFVVAAGGIAVLDADTLAVKRRVAIPGGNDARGFALDAAGNFYFANFYSGTVNEYSSGVKLTRVLGPAYRATLTVPDALTVGGETVLPLKVEKIATGDGTAAVPQFKLALQPASLSGEPDSNYANSTGAPDVNWWLKRRQQYEAGERPLAATGDTGGLRVQVPGTTPTDLYQLIVRETGSATEQAQVVAAVAPGTTGGLTLLVGHNRSVFQQGEPLEINAVLRDQKVVRAGKLKISLAKRRGQELVFRPGQPAWKEFAVAGGAASQTLTFKGDTAAIYPGRYLVQAEFTAAGVQWHDAWPVEIVSAVVETRFKILFPEWSAGYTDIWGPFTGKGMAADAAALARTGVNFYDATILHRGAAPPLQATGPEADRVAALARLADAAPQVPAAEKYAVASPLEIELQEALRSGLSMQRDIWGSHDMPDWGFGNDLSVAVDNRRARIWTQWQREWPSWAGHRYLTLAGGGDDYPETKALQAKLGIKPPTAAELDWARNGASWLSERGFISDAPIRSELTISAVATDAAGDIYVAASGTLLKYDAAGELLHQTKLPGGEMIDMTVAPDGTVYIADPSSGRVIVVGRDDAVTTWPVQQMSNYSPRGIWMDRDGSLLLSDMNKGRVHRYTTAGKLLQEFGSPEILKAAHGIATLKDGTIYVADAQGGLSVFKADGTPVRFLPGLGGGAPGGKMDVCAAPDDTLWVTGLSQITHADRDGKVLGRVGHSTFAPGGLSLAMSVALTPGGHLLIADVATPYAQEWTQAGDPVRLLGTGTLFAEARLDRMRYTWTTPIIASLRRPIEALQGDAKSQLQAFARLATKDGSGEWKSVGVKLLSGTDYQITPPRLEGTVTLRLVWAGAGAGADNPLHTDFSIQVSSTVSAADAAKMTDIVARQIGWKEAWSKARMGTLVRWTKASNEIARSQGRADTQNLAPTNYGTLDNLASGVWTPLRREAVVAEANNEGHDYGSFPLHGAWYVARTLDGPDAKPIWASLLQWYWFDREDSTGRKTLSPRPMRDLAVLLGTGVSGMGPGKLPTAMGAPQRALMGKMVDRLHRLGEATTQLKAPGEGGVAVLYSFTQEAMDPYNEEHFWTGHAAWYDLLRAHIPTAVVTEDSIARGALLNRFRAVLIPNIQYALPPRTLAALAEFRKLGGEVWVDAGTRAAVPGAKLLRTRYRPFWIQDAYYWVHSGYGIGGYDGNSEYTTMKSGSNSRLPALLEAFGKYREAAVSTDDPDVFVQTRRGGEATYVFASNDHFPKIPLYKTYLAAEAPVPATVRFTLKGGAIYDALAMKRMSAGAAPVVFTDAEPARIFAVLPRPIQSVALRATYLERAIFGTVKVLDGGGKALAAVIPLQITVTDAAGQKRTLWRATDAQGVCRFRVEAGWQAPAGAWRVEARELLNGKTAVPVRPAVTQPAPAPLVQDKAAALVFDAPAIKAQLARLKGKELWIALDKDQTALRPLADGLAQTLGEAGIRAKVVRIPDIPQVNLVSDYTLTADQLAAWEQVRAGASVGLRQPSTTYREVGPDRVVMRPLILLGTAAQNSWLAEIEKWKLTRRTASTQYPGQGRALVQYVWSPFYDGFDVITVGAGDAEGLKAGIAAVENAAR